MIGNGLLFHYIKIAFRNMWKYKNQTLISVIGLAVGFTCFSLATLWIRYETSFDSFLKNSKQIYVVYTPNSGFIPIVYKKNSSIRLATRLKETFPEIANAVSLIANPGYLGKDVTVEGVEVPALTIVADSAFSRMFDVKILEGSNDFLVFGNNKIAVTREKALQLFGKENPIGKTVISKFAGTYTICAVVSVSKRSNYPFDFIRPFNVFEMEPSSGSNVNTIIELLSRTNIETFEKKLHEFNSGIIKPITKIRYTDTEIEREVEFQYVLIFAISGLLVVLCSLFNYLISFVSRFRIRQSEIALRMVCGASGRSLLVMLLVEFMFTLLIAVVLGCMLTQLFHKPFLTLSYIKMDLLDIYRESLMYIGCVILVFLLTFWLILLVIRRRNLNLSIRRSNKKPFRKISMVIQLIICATFAFCTIVMLKQIYFLHNANELGFSFRNTGAIMVSRENRDILANQLKQIPEITEVINMNNRMFYLLTPNFRFNFVINSWDDQSTDAENVKIEEIIVSPEYINFYNFKLLSGEKLNYSDTESTVLINETAAKAFGWYDPVGKQFGNSTNRYTVKGVIKDIYNFAPTEQVGPSYYRTDTKGEINNSLTVLFKYREDTWKSCKEKIEYLIKDEYTIYSRTAIHNSEEDYNSLLKSENALIMLLSFFSAICVLICVSGFVSMVSLTCEERRKEIAIRKINGATAGDILAIFAREYFLLLMIGAVIAFSIGYFIMQQWLENYVKRTTIPAWIYLSIVFVLALMIVLCVGWQIYKASVENPAEVVKK